MRIDQAADMKPSSRLLATRSCVAILRQSQGEAWFLESGDVRRYAAGLTKDRQEARLLREERPAVRGTTLLSDKLNPIYEVGLSKPAARQMQSLEC